MIQIGTSSMSHTLFRVGAAIFVFFMLLVGVFSIYWIWEHVLHLYGRLYRNAPVVETSYLAFALLMVPPTVLLITVGGAIAIWTGDRKSVV